MFKILGQFGESVISNNLIFSENQDEMKGGGMKAILKWIIFKSGKKKIKIKIKKLKKLKKKLKN